MRCHNCFMNIVLFCIQNDPHFQWDTKFLFCRVFNSPLSDMFTDRWLDFYLALNCFVFLFNEPHFESKLSFCSFPAVCAIPFIFAFNTGDSLHNASPQKVSTARCIAILFPSHSLSLSVCGCSTPLDTPFQFESAKSHTVNSVKRKPIRHRPNDKNREIFLRCKNTAISASI